MKPSIALHRKLNEFRLVFQQNPKFSNVRMIGSVAQCQDDEGSDLDLYVDASRETTLFDIGKLIEELEETLDIDIDVSTSLALINDNCFKFHDMGCK